MVEQREVKPESLGPRRPGDGGDRRDSVMTVPGILQWRLSFGCPNLLSQWLQQIATFVKENHASLPVEALFLSAAIRRGTSERSRFRFVHGLSARASVGSNPTSAIIAVRSARGTRRRISDESDLAREVPSNPTGRTPSNAFPSTTREPSGQSSFATIEERDQDAAWAGACSHVSKPPASDAPTRRLHLPRRQHPLTTFPARTIGPRFSDELRAIRDFRGVSSQQLKGLHRTFH